MQVEGCFKQNLMEYSVNMVRENGIKHGKIMHF